MSVRNTGVFDVLVSEVLWRTIDVGEVLVDVGANIGYMTALMAFRSGPHGRVISFEPHPEVFRDLAENVALWKGISVAPIEARREAVSSVQGQCMLEVDASFTRNRATAHLVRGIRASSATNHVTVDTVRLDDVLHDVVIGVMKVDVEGHETAVMHGAGSLLRAGRIRDIVFEDHAASESRTIAFLHECGYAVFAIESGFWKPRLVPVDTKSLLNPPRFDAPSFIATRNPERLRHRFRSRSRGWAVLRG